MTTLVEDVAKLIAGCEALGFSPIGIADTIIPLIQSHPETLERRRRDFEAGKARATHEIVNLNYSFSADDSPGFDDYLASEKGEK